MVCNVMARRLYCCREGKIKINYAKCATTTVCLRYQSVQEKIITNK